MKKHEAIVEIIGQLMQTYISLFQFIKEITDLRGKKKISYLLAIWIDATRLKPNISFFYTSILRIKHKWRHTDLLNTMF